MEAFCATCEAKSEVEPVEDGEPGAVFCLSCGEEFVPVSEDAKKFANFVTGKVVAVEEVPKKDLKKCQVDLGGPVVTVVTNAKHVYEEWVVVVATEGAVVPAGAVPGEDPNAVVVKKSSVGGVKSEGMLCDSPMLGWVGGSKGAVVRLPDDFALGALPPSERPAKAET